MATATRPRLDPADVKGHLWRIARHRRAVVPLAELPEVLGLSDEDAVGVLDTLLDDDLAELWPDAPTGPAMVLTSAATSSIGLELVAADNARAATKAGTRSLRWVETRRVKPEKSRLLLMADLVTQAGMLDAEDALDRIPDPRPLDLESRIIISVIRRPGLRLWGFGLTGWTPALEHADPCLVCAGRRFGSQDFCLACCRMGGDEKGKPTEEIREEPEAPAPSLPPADGLAGGIGPTRPKRPKRPKRAPAVERGPSPLDEHRKANPKNYSAGWMKRRAART